MDVAQADIYGFLELYGHKATDGEGDDYKPGERERMFGTALPRLQQCVNFSKVRTSHRHESCHCHCRCHSILYTVCPNIRGYAPCSNPNTPTLILPLSKRCDDVAVNLVQQLVSCASPDTEAVQPTYFTRGCMDPLFTSLGDLLCILMTMDALVRGNAHLNEAWAHFKALMSHVRMGPDLYDTEDETVTKFERMLVDVDTKLFRCDTAAPLHRFIARIPHGDYPYPCVVHLTHPSSPLSTPFLHPSQWRAVPRVYRAELRYHLGRGHGDGGGVSTRRDRRQAASGREWLAHLPRTPVWHYTYDGRNSCQSPLCGS